MSGSQKALPKSKKVVFSLLLAALSLVLVLLLGEVLVRLTHPAGSGFASREALDRKLQESARTEVHVVHTGNLKGLVRPSANHELVYELKPSRRWIFKGADTRTDRHGLRGPERTLEKPAGTYRVAGIGDSFMFGWGVDQDRTYMALLEQRLSGSLEGARVEVLNFGVPGYNSAQEAIVLREKGLAFAPDVLLVGYALNDWAAPFFVRDPQKDGIVETSFLLQLIRDRVLPQLDESYFDGLRGGDKVRAALGEIAALAARHGLPVIFFVHPQQAEPEAFENLERLARQSGFVYVDVPAGVRAYIEERNLAGLEALQLGHGDPHPNAEGHRLMARLLEPALRAALEAVVADAAR